MQDVYLENKEKEWPIKPIGAKHIGNFIGNRQFNRQFNCMIVLGKLGNKKKNRGPGDS